MTATKLRTYTVINFTMADAMALRTQLQEAVEEGQGIFPVYISSGGGSSLALLAMIDILQSSPIPVATISTGASMSAGAFLLPFGTKGYRYASPSSQLMFHGASFMTGGTIPSVEADVAFVKNLQRTIIKLVANVTSLSEERWEKSLSQEKDHFITAEKALSYGIVDKVEYPFFSIQTTANYNSLSPYTVRKIESTATSTDTL